MVLRGVTGVLSTTQNNLGFEVVWSIEDFLSLSTKDGDWYNSDIFTFNNSRWCLGIIPDGASSSLSLGYVGLRLCAWDKPVFPISVNISVSLKTASGSKSSERHAIKVFTDQDFSHGFSLFISRKEVRRNQTEFLPSGILTVVCRLKIEVPARNENLESLSEDYKKVLLDGSNHDLILKVGDTELRAHRDILKARSKVFYSMLTHDMLEKNGDPIEIPDCDPEAMKLFLLYVYSGRVEGLDQSSMLKLYYIADKYEVLSLKEECHNFIKVSFSSTNFCDIIQLALNHSDSSLLEHATEYFLRNTLAILKTVKWQSFLKTHSIVANELFIKSQEIKK